MPTMVHYHTLNISRPPHLGSGSWILENLKDITVLFGKNGAGKSKLLRTLRDGDKAAFHYSSPERSGEISFNIGHTQSEFTGDSRAGKHTSNLAPSYREEVIARIQAYLAKKGGIRRSTPHVPNLVELEELEDMLHVLLPEFQVTIEASGNNPFKLVRSVSGQVVNTVNDLSSGESEVVTLALDLLLICAIWQIEGRSNCLLLVDEPDTHLHPDLQQHLAKFLVELTEKFKVQMLVSTHSTTLLSALGYHGEDKTGVIYLNNAAEVQKTIEFNEALQILSTCLGGHALMGPLFGAPLLLVEGDDDYQIWSQAPRHGVVKLAAIPCRGDNISEYQKMLETIFLSLLPGASAPSGFVLKDGDKPKDSIEHSHMKSLNLACLESENLYLADEVLGHMNTNWEEAKMKIKSEAHNYGSKEEFLLTVDGWDRKTTDIKAVILELSQIIDDKHVRWTQRVGKALGEKKPEGQLAEFLGGGVVNAFWQ